VVERSRRAYACRATSRVASAPTSARRAVLVGSALVALITACGGGEVDEYGAPRAPDPLLSAPPVVLARSLARASGEVAYVVDSAVAQGSTGRIQALVRASDALPPDTLTRPTHDAQTCVPAPDAPFTGSRDGLGDAVAWLVGVRRGAADPAPRRVTISLAGCQIQPRISRVPLGATVLVRSADAIDARLRFLDVTDERPSRVSGDSTPSAMVVSPTAPRALVPLFDAGAVVPLTSVTATPGLVEIRDDRHPWVRGWLAVAPHPFVAISDASGRFTFDGVPTGRYVLVTWHERLGTVATDVRVERGVDTRVTITLPVSP
jgi:hypothetical protein